jgi:hypothetical protein
VCSDGLWCLERASIVLIYEGTNQIWRIVMAASCPPIFAVSVLPVFYWVISYPMGSFPDRDNDHAGKEIAGCWHIPGFPMAAAWSVP